ncbi:hypothetical protein AB833_10405 [Chromatiales bacterium (ex Bugula neritina AB1)]|nr:hypothetical protein AB833_10405 [Chromatiales bacterium (ex Bugula neritina AB1)]
MTTMVEVKSLSKRFGQQLAVDNISLSVARGEVLGFLGPNGSGKSTTMKMITGFITPTRGSVSVGGVNVQHNPIAAQRQIGYLPEGAPVYAETQVLAYLKFIAEIRGLGGAAARDAISRAAERTNIESVLYQSVETLSKGYKRRVGLAQALLHNPPVLILDEPTDGLDPNQKYEVRQLIGQIAADKAIIISTHILEEVDTICSRAIIIANGRVVADGTPAELEQRSRYHNAVALTLADTDADPACSEISALAAVEEVLVSPTPDNQRQLLAIASNGADILSEIAPMVQTSAWTTQQLELKRGRLDDVFREVTTGGDHAVIESSLPEWPQSTVAKTGSSWRADVVTICKRELSSYFTTPIAYVFIVIFLATLGAFTFFPGGFFEQRQATLDSFFQFHPWLYLFLIPAIAMRLWAEERKSGSIELLLTLPVNTASAVIGKFTAAWLVAGLALLLTSTFWITVNYLGSPDNGVIAAGYIGSFFMAGGYLAIGSFVSAATRNQVIAFIVSAALCFIFTASGLGVVLDFFSGWAPQSVLVSVANFSFLEHFKGISRGLIQLQDLVFFLSTIVFFLFATVVTVELKKNA